MSWHNTAKSTDSVVQVNAAAVRGRTASLPGEISDPGGGGDTAAPRSAIERGEGREVRRGHSTERNEPARAGGLTIRKGRTWQAVSTRAGPGTGEEADWLSLVHIQQGRERVLHHPSGLPGTAGCGAACPVVCGAGAKIPRLPDWADPRYSANQFAPHRPVTSRFESNQRSGKGAFLNCSMTAQRFRGLNAWGNRK